MPPHRVLQNDQISAIQLFDLRSDNIGDGPLLGGMELLGLHIEAPRLLS